MAASLGEAENASLTAEEGFTDAGPSGGAGAGGPRTGEAPGTAQQGGGQGAFREGAVLGPGCRILGWALQCGAACEHPGKERENKREWCSAPPCCLLLPVPCCLRPLLCCSGPWRGVWRRQRRGV